VQEFRFLERFLTHITTQKLDCDIYARLATPSSDNNLWIFDDKDHSLKKSNLNHFDAEILTSLNNLFGGTFQVSHLREYQNFVFLSDAKNGIYVFDNFGNFIKQLPFSGASYFNFHKNELYFIDGSALTFYNIYSTETRHLELNTDQKYSFGLVSEKQL